MVAVEIRNSKSGFIVTKADSSKTECFKIRNSNTNIILYYEIVYIVSEVSVV